jgi:hypothetical protein
MLLLSNLSEEGYLQLKKDRESVYEKIKELHRVLAHFDASLSSMSTIYDPNIDVYEANEFYFGRFKIKHPDIENEVGVDYKIGLIKEFLDDDTLKRVSKEKAREEVKKMFPLYFH